jgi:ribosomal protein S27E
LISAACPSCGAPLVFAHAASLTAVCGACDSTVVRDDITLRDLGKLAPFVRELSPLQVGASGTFEGRPFRVAGGLRRVRPGVRWNEWYLVFDDGAVGWLGEGNGQLQIFAAPPLPVPELAAPPAVGEKRSLGGVDWTVSEVSEAALAAGVGELPFTPTLGAPVPYADLRGANGAVGTLDWASGQSVLYVGVVVDITALKLEGLRAFAGWSDPVLVSFQGPELEPSRTLACPSCGVAVVLRAPADAARTTCLSCGSVIGHSEGGATLIEAATATPRSFRLKLGARGRLEDVPWEILGLLERYVIEDGERYTWTEYLLHNPYRGYRWLVHADGGEWSLVTLLTTPPTEHGARSREHEGVVFHWANEGMVVTSYVLGELTWEAKVGDRVAAVDYKAGAGTLSVEVADDEITWSRGRRIRASAVFDAFEPVAPNVQRDRVKPKPATTRWLPPTDPSPYAQGIRPILTLGLSGFAAVLGVVGLLIDPSDSVFVDSSMVGSGEEPYVSAPFDLPERTNGAVRVSLSAPKPLAGSLINLETGALYESVSWDGRIDLRARPGPGRYVVRASLPSSPALVPISVGVEAGVVSNGPSVLLLVWAGVGPIALLLFHLSWFYSNGTREPIKPDPDGASGGDDDA